MTNGIGMKLALIPPGEFIMGSPNEEFGRTSDELPHRVRITKPFYLGIHEVTVAQFRRFIAETGYQPYRESYSRSDPDLERCMSLSKAPNEDAFSWHNPGFPQRDDHPVVNVSWTDAVAFCRWLSERDNLTYRLPTEAEWEYACRAGTTQPYSMEMHGDDRPFPANLRRTARGQSSRPFTWNDGFRHTAPVGSFPPNRLGLYDMHGNVCEYCSDCYEESYYRQSPTCDPQGPESGNNQVIRGGGWNSDLIHARSARRTPQFELMGCAQVGFRVARTTARLSWQPGSLAKPTPPHRDPLPPRSIHGNSLHRTGKG